MRSSGRWPIRRLADFLGISRDTTKRLFKRQVFPEDWVSKSPGGKWFLTMNDHRRREAEFLLNRWRVIRRKPAAAAAFPDPWAASSVPFALSELRVLGGPATKENLADLARIMSLPAGQKELRRMTEKIGNHCNTEKGHALMLMVTALLRFRQRFGPAATPTFQDMAEELGCSVPSLYREPFGKGMISAATEIIEEASMGGSIAEVETLACRLSKEPTVEEVREELAISAGRAADLLEDWREEEVGRMALTSGDGIPGDELGRDHSNPGQGGDSRSSRDNPDDPGGEEAKKKRDRVRAGEARKMRLAWSQVEKGRIPVVYLTAVPWQAAKTLEEVTKETGVRSRNMGENNRRPRAITARNLDKAMAKMKADTVRLGCVFMDGERIEARVFNNGGVLRAKFFDEPGAATCWLLDEIRRILPQARRKVAADWESLRGEASVLSGDMLAALSATKLQAT